MAEQSSDYRAPDGVGLLPGDGGPLPLPIVSTFAILANASSSNELCHFCLQPCNIEAPDEDPYFRSIFAPTVMKLNCCGHHIHCDCFMKWALSPLNEHTLRCAYCRTVYEYRAKCFLCLEALKDRPQKYTSCCGSRVHSDCADALTRFCQMRLTFECTLECGQLRPCACLWKAA